MGRFSELQQVAEKTVKYKMNNHIDAAFFAGMISETIYTGTVTNGACAALTGAWLAQCLNSPKQFAHNFERNKGVSSKLLPSSESYTPIGVVDNNLHLASLASPYQHEMVQMKKEYNGQDYEWLASQFGFQVLWSLTGGDDFISALKLYAVDAQDNLKPGQGIFFNYVSTPDNVKPPQCHSVGVCRVDNSEEIQFFDANVGAYKIKTNRVEEFATKYKNIIDKIPDWFVGDGVGYRVTRIDKHNNCVLL